MKNKIEQIIIEILTELNEELEKQPLNNPTRDTKLYGENGSLDSLALVTLITDLEAKISEEFDSEIIIADEKAMSQTTSPFRSIGTLAVYIEGLLEE